MKTIETQVMFQFRSENTADYYSSKYYDGFVLEQGLYIVDPDGNPQPVPGDLAKHFHPTMVVQCECPRCDGTGFPSYDPAETGCWVCEGKGYEWKSAMAWVNVYEIERCYGGPEEGGWYYDAHSFIEGHPVIRSEAEELKENLIISQRWRNEGDISSVLGGTKLAVYIEEFEAESETKVTPRYE